MQNEQNINSNNAAKEDGKKETITELAHRHLRDENHTTSDEELRNAKVEFSEEPKESEEAEGNLFEVDNTTLTDGITTNDETTDDDNKSENSDPPNPYTILNP